MNSTNNPIPPPISGFTYTYAEAEYQTLSRTSYYPRSTQEYTQSESGVAAYEDWVPYPFGQSGVQGWGALDLFRGIESPTITQDAPNVLTDCVSAYRQTYSYTDNYSGEIRINMGNDRYIVISGFNDYISIDPNAVNTYLRKYPQYDDLGSIPYLNSAAYTQICYNAEYWHNHGGNYSGHIATLQLNPIYVRLYDYTPSGQFTYSVSCPLAYPLQVPSGWSFSGHVPEKYIASGSDMRDVVNNPAYFLDAYANDIFVQFTEFYSGMLENPKDGPFHPSWPSLATLSFTNHFYRFDNEGGIDLPDSDFKYQFVKHKDITTYFPDYQYLTSSGAYSANIPRPAIELSGNLRLHNIDRELSIDRFYTEDEILSITSGIPLHTDAGPQWYFFQQCQNPHWFVRNIHSKTQLNTFLKAPLDLPPTGDSCQPKLVDFIGSPPVVDLILSEINFGNTSSGIITIEVNADLNSYELIGKQKHTNGSFGPPIILDVIPYFTIQLKEKGGLFNDPGKTYRAVALSGIDGSKSGRQIATFQPGVPYRDVYGKILPPNTPFNPTEVQKLTRNPYAGYELKLQNYWVANYNCSKSAPLLEEFDSMEFEWSPSISGMASTSLLQGGDTYYGHRIAENPHLQCDIDLKINDIAVSVTDIPGSAVLKTPTPSRVGIGWKHDRYTVYIKVYGSVTGGKLSTIAAALGLDWLPGSPAPHEWFVFDYIDLRIDPACGRIFTPLAKAIFTGGVTSTHPLLHLPNFENEANITGIICAFSDGFDLDNNLPKWEYLLVSTDAATRSKAILSGDGAYSMLCGQTMIGSVRASVPDYIVRRNLATGEVYLDSDDSTIPGTEIICVEKGRTLTVRLDYAEVTVIRTYDNCTGGDTEIVDVQIVPMGNSFELNHLEEAQFSLDIPCGMASGWF